MKLFDALSFNEVELFNKLGYAQLLLEVDTGSFGPVDLYVIAVKDCFLEDKKGPEVEALRRAYKAIRNVEVYRNTPEFEELIKI